MNPAATIHAFYQHIIDKNTDEIGHHYVNSPNTYVVLEGPRLTTKGYEKIMNGWRDFCQSNLSLHSIEWQEGPFCEEMENMAWLSGVIALKVEANGKQFSNTFRATFVVVKEESKWKIKHEHVSAAMSDPYGIGDWLKPK